MGRPTIFKVEPNGRLKITHLWRIRLANLVLAGLFKIDVTSGYGRTKD